MASVFLALAQTMSGVMSINMPVVLKGFNYLNPLRYVLRNLAPYSLKDIEFSCTDYQRLPDGRCTIETGKDVLRLYDLDTNPAINIALLGVCAVVYRLLAYLLLKAMRTHWGSGKGKVGAVKQ